MKRGHCKKAGKHTVGKKGLLLYGLASLLWFILRTGTKPTRIVYPCQQAALTNISMVLCVFTPFPLAVVIAKTRVFARKKLALLTVLAVVLGALTSCIQPWNSQLLAKAVDPYQELRLTLEPANATVIPSSDVFVVCGRAHAYIDELLNLMGSHGLPFYMSNNVGSTQGPEGLIARDDVVLIKINEEWPYRGGTNTDVLMELIQSIVDHPDGFVGEVVVADNGQWQGSMDWPESNAEDPTQSTQDVVNSFSSQHNVSTCSWIPIRGTRVNEYIDGDSMDGYVLYDTPDQETGIYVSYPKFTTVFGTCISFKRGVWNGIVYENRLKVINMPVLKSHNHYGVTGALKHYMGVQSEGGRGQAGLGNGHEKVASGGMGTLMVETGLPTLNIVDAIWINANPPPSSSAGPSTPYDRATRVNVLVAGADPVALDYWAAKHVLMQAAGLIGYSDVHTLDPDDLNRTGVISQAFGVWLNLTMHEILAAGHNVTTDLNRMNVYVSASTVHDIAVREVVVSESLAGEGGLNVNISVTTQNVGDFSEVFDLSIYADVTLIQTKTLELPSAGLTITKFLWNTTGWSEGYYSLRAYAWPVEGETNVADNECLYGMLWVPEFPSLLLLLPLTLVALLAILLKRRELLSSMQNRKAR